jgi:hypothetical protein
MTEQKLNKFVLNLQKDIPKDTFLSMRAKFKLDKNGNKKFKPEEWWFNIENIDNIFLLYNRLIPISFEEPYKSESKKKYFQALLKRYNSEPRIEENIINYKNRSIYRNFNKKSIESLKKINLCIFNRLKLFKKFSSEIILS